MTIWIHRWRTRCGSWKTYLAHLRFNFLKIFKPTPEISYNESIVEYYVSHGCEQFLRGKPIRFGYKVWVFNINDCCFIYFEVYKGRSFARENSFETEVGVCAAPLIRFIEHLPAWTKNLLYPIYFDIYLFMFVIRSVVLISLCFVALMRNFSLGELCSHIRPVVPHGHWTCLTLSSFSRDFFPKK